MKDWLLPTLFIPIVWGFWGLLPKLAVRYINPFSAIVFEILGMMVFGIFVLIYMDFRLEVHPRGLIFAFFAGILGATGAILYLIGVSKGKVSVIVLISAMYPVITITLAFILLKEPITIKEAFGMLFAGIAIILFSI